MFFSGDLVLFAPPQSRFRIPLFLTVSLFFFYYRKEDSPMLFFFLETFSPTSSLFFRRGRFRHLLVPFSAAAKLLVPPAIQFPFSPRDTNFSVHPQRASRSRRT